MPTVKLNDDVNIANSSILNGSLNVDQKTMDQVAVNDGESEKNLEKTNEKLEPENLETEDEWLDVLGSGQLKMKVLQKGEPDTRPQPLDICEIRLRGTLEDGTIVENFNTIKIQLGCHEVVQGVELAVPLMSIGEESIVVVAPRFAYGAIGNPPKIPPNATITYNITLINSEPECDLEKISFEKRKLLANNKKDRGNWWYSRQDSNKAIQCYRKALDILDETVPFSSEDGSSVEYSEEQVREVVEQKLLIYNNLAAAQLMIEAYELALMSVNRVLLCDAKNVKALFRKGKILTAKGQINEAVEVLRQAFLLEPENSAIKMELSRCVKIQKTEKQHEKNLYRKMFGHDKKDEKTTENAKKKNSRWTKVLGTAATATVMAAIAFAVCYRFKDYSFL